MPAPEPLECSDPNCSFQTPQGCPSWELMVKLLTQHAQTVHGNPANPGHSAAKLEKLPRPTFTLNMTESQWTFTKLQWDHYIGQSPVSEATKLTQLQAACNDDLRQRVFDTGLYHNLTTPDMFIQQMEKLAVNKVHKSVHLRNLWRMIQQPDENIRAFVARLTSTADMCKMSVTCECAKEVSYRDNVIMQLIIHGMKDNDIRIRVMSRNTSGELTTLDKLVNYIQAEEAGKNESNDLTSEDYQIGEMRRKSSYRKGKSTCSYCGNASHSKYNSPDDRKKLCKAYGTTCSNCKLKNHFSSVCRQKNKVSAITTNDGDQKESDAEISNIESFFSLASSGPNVYGSNSPPTSVEDLSPVICSMRNGDHGPVTSLPLPHYIHDLISGWIQTKPDTSPTLSVQFTVDRKAYAELSLPMPRFKSGHHPGRASNISSVCDTGAQLTVIPKTILHNMRIKEDSVFPVQTRIHGVSDSPIMVDGGILLTITAENPSTGLVRTSRQLAYISAHVRMPYLSKQACIDLGVIGSNFPEVGYDDPEIINSAMVATTSPTSCSNSGIPNASEPQCNCPPRELPPPVPTVLPCAPTEENLPVLRKYILDRYASSAFNCCEHQPLRLMDKSPPLRIYTDETAKPKAVHTPSVVPLHWKNAVKDGLDRDERLGVIEKVPVNSPVGWCSRMVVTSKSDGSPRRVVDYTELNKYTPRQTHHTPSPWTIVCSIPPRQVKSVLDCWHGYHSVPLHPGDRHLTTFVTEWGRYRYRTVPQGLISAGDAYTQRKAEIMTDIPGQATCVDDSILYDDSIEQNFYKVCKFLTTGSQGGCTFNPQKFQFGKQEVNFLGFLITADGVQTTPEFRESILNFPTPKNITDIRSWFGCVNQVSYSFATAPIMAPFRHLLSSKVPFEWSPQLQEAFEASKREILRQCEKGVRSFDPILPTALATDWAKVGVGFWLTQKHCSCPISSTPVPGCCPSGWQTIYCGSKFCSPAESRYHPIEGEALAAIYGLQKCKFFVLGLENLILTLDHKPLVPIFNQKQQIEDIENPRILNFKLKSLLFRFTATHVPGKKNATADTFSRKHKLPQDQERSTFIENKDADDSASIHDYSSTLAPPHWVSPPTQLNGLNNMSQRTNHFSCEEVQNLPASLARLACVRKPCEIQIAPEHIFVGNIMSCIASVNSWSRTAPITSLDKPEALSWRKLVAACM